jgi:hypothetical protein
LTLTNGMPIDQSSSNGDSPHYVGFGPEPEFSTIGEDMGDDKALTSQDPGLTVER